MMLLVNDGGDEMEIDLHTQDFLMLGVLSFIGHPEFVDAPGFEEISAMLRHLDSGMVDAFVNHEPKKEPSWYVDYRSTH